MWILLMNIGLLLLAAFGYYINYRYVKKFMPKAATVVGIYGIVAILYAMILLGYYALNQGNFHSLRWGFFVFLLSIMPPIFFAIYWLVAVFPFFRFHRFRNISTLVGITLATVVFLMILHGGLIGRTKLTVKTATVESVRLPESFNGFRIVQFSDIHLGSFKGEPDFVQKMVERVNSLNPDVVLFTGDIVNTRSEEMTEFIDILSGIRSKYGVYSVLGNHDYGDYVQWPTPKDKENNLKRVIGLQEQWGWKVLIDEHQYIHIGQDSIAIIGVGNWGEKSFKQYGDLKKAYQSVEPATFGVLLSHNPIHWREEVFPTTHIDLMLAGHTHAWQMRIGSLSPSVILYPEWSGLYHEGNRFLYVNQGLGSVFFPMRIGAWPELTLIELKTK